MATTAATTSTTIAMACGHCTAAMARVCIIRRTATRQSDTAVTCQALLRGRENKNPVNDYVEHDVIKVEKNSKIAIKYLK